MKDFLFLYGVGLLVTAETGLPAVIRYSACVYLYLCESGRGRKVSALYYDDCFRGNRNCFQRNVDISPGGFI